MTSPTDLPGDRIILSGIELYAFGGVTEGEKKLGQRYRVTVQLHLDLRSAERSDYLDDTVSYASVHDTVVLALRERPFNLLEAAAGRVAHRILERFPVDTVTVRLEKLLPPIDGVLESAAVEITRTRGD